MGRKWSREDIARLRNSQEPVPVLAEQLGRSSFSIWSKAWKLGVKLAKNPKPHWITEDTELLKTHYPTENKEDLLKLFPDRSWESIQHKASKLHLSRPFEYFYPKSIRKLTLAQRGYLAGLIDGEGTITILKHSKRSYLTPIVSVCNTCKEAIDYCRSLLQGFLRRELPSCRRKVTLWTLRLSKFSDIKSLLEQLIPFMIIKKRRAELLLEFCTLRLKNKWTRHDPRLFEIAKEIRRLNRREG